MVYIIVKKNKFSEKYMRPGGIQAAERDGIRKGDAFIAINEMTSSGVTVDERRDIVNEFIDRPKG